MSMEQFDVLGHQPTHDEMVRKIEETTAVNEARMEMAMGNVDQQKIKIEEEAEKLRANELVKQFKAEMGIVAPEAAPPHRRRRPSAREPKRRKRRSSLEENTMAVKIERGGYVLIFLLGLGLVGYSLQSVRAPERPQGARLGLRYNSDRQSGHCEAVAGRRHQRCKCEQRARAPEYLGGLRGRPGGQRRPGYRRRLHLRQ